jgi:hypothetical protein
LCYNSHMTKTNAVFSGFGKPGELVEERTDTYNLNGNGTDLGCVLEIREEIKRPSLLTLEVMGSIKLGQPWSRLRIEIFDKEHPETPATSFEDAYLMEGLSPEHFKPLSFPVLGIVKQPYKVQIMVVGPSQTSLQIRNVHLS